MQNRGESERSFSSAMPIVIKEGSDDGITRIPESGSEAAGPSNSFQGAGYGGGGKEPKQPAVDGQMNRGKSQAEKEHKRLKRLLRNRVSAQQARERMKMYLSELELRVEDLEKKNFELEERLSTLQNENQMLRHILKNTTAG